MYFFFFYFLAEINPLSILLLSTYIKPQARPKYPSQRKEKSPYTQSTTKVGNLAQRLFSRKSRDSTDESRVAVVMARLFHVVAVLTLQPIFYRHPTLFSFEYEKDCVTCCV